MKFISTFIILSCCLRYVQSQISGRIISATHYLLNPHYISYLPSKKKPWPKQRSFPIDIVFLLQISKIDDNCSQGQTTFLLDLQSKHFKIQNWIIKFSSHALVYRELELTRLISSNENCRPLFGPFRCTYVPR